MIAINSAAQKKDKGYKQIATIVGLIFFSIIWKFFIAPQITKIPRNFSYSANVISVDNLYESDISAYRGEQYSKTNFSYSVIARDGDILTIKNTFDVRSLGGQQLYKNEPLYGIDAVTGAHVKGYGDRNRDGYLFAPRWLKKGQSFTYWHASNDIPAKMNYVSEESLYGLKVYKYETSYGGPVDQTKVLDFLPGVPEERGVKLESKNFLWVEPISGYLVKQEDFSTDYYFYDIKSGEKLYPYNKFINTFSEEDVKRHVAVAKNKKYTLYAVDIFVPVLVIGLSGLLFLMFFGKLNRFRNFLSDNKVSLIVFLALFSSTVFVYVNFKKNTDERLQIFFDEQSADFIGKLTNRFNIYTNALFDARAFFDASSNVSRQDWKMYVESLDLKKHYPGMDLFGYAKVVSKEEKNEFTKVVRGSDLPDFAIWPDGDRERYVVAYYSEPFNEKSKKSMGFDALTDNARRMALEKAIVSGDISLTSKLILAYDKRSNSNSAPGFLAFVPVYKGGVIPKEAKDRLQMIDGFVTAPFVVDEVIGKYFGLKEGNLEIRIYDGLATTPESLMYDSRGVSYDGANILYRKVQTVYIANRPWTIEFYNSSNFKWNSIDRYLPTIILFGGIFFSVLLYIIFYFFFSTKKNILSEASKLTAELEKNRSELEEKNKILEEKLQELDSINKAMVDRELKMIELKKKIDK